MVRESFSFVESARWRQFLSQVTNARIAVVFWDSVLELFAREGKWKQF